MSGWRWQILIALRGLPIYFEVIVKAPFVAIISVTILLSLAACGKHISGRYICRQDSFEFKSDGTLTISDVKTGALENERQLYYRERASAADERRGELRKA